MAYLAAGWGWGVQAGDDEAVSAVRQPAGAGRTAAAASPAPDVTQGAKPHGTSRLYGFDWIRFTGKLDDQELVERWAANRFGAEFTDQHGFSFYERCRTYKGGAKVLTDHDSGNSVMVELSGDALELHTPEDRLQLVRELVGLGLKATRLDIAIDTTGKDVGLIEAVTAACQRGELCGARSWKPITEYNHRGEVDSFGVNLGRRGNDGSGRYVRIYDKGLETGESKQGRWVRWEAEFTGSVAAQVAAELHWTDRPLEVMTGHALGAVDFRGGEHHQSLSRRPRASWWTVFKGGREGLRFTKVRRLSNLRGRVTWLKESVGLALAGMAHATGQEVMDVCRELFRDLEFGADVLQRAAATVPAQQYAYHRQRPAAFKLRRSFRLS